MSKLYTEYEVRILLKDLLGLDKSVNDAIDSLEPIELPTLEDISEVAMVVYGFNHISLHHQAKDVKDVLQYKAFKRGAKWMRDKIKGGNNE